MIASLPVEIKILLVLGKESRKIAIKICPCYAISHEN